MATSFGAAVPILIGQSADAFVSADFNRDGIADIAVSGDQEIGIYYGLSDGGFKLGQTLQINRGFGLQVVDLDGDKWPDLLGLDTSGLELFYNLDGEGFLNTPFAPSIQASRVAVADLDGDGRLDLALCSEAGLQTALDFLADFGPNGPLFISASTEPCFHVLTASLVVGARPALVSDTYSGGIVVLLPIGDGGFLPPSTYRGAENGVSDVVGVDLNRDGFIDVAAATQDGLVIYTNVDGGSFSVGIPLSPGISPGPELDELEVLDVNGDGFPDIVADGLGSQPCTSLAWPVVFQNNCAGGFQPAATYNVGLIEAAGLGVLDRQGTSPGILVNDWCAGQLMLMPNLGTGFPE